MSSLLKSNVCEELKVVVRIMSGINLLINGGMNMSSDDSNHSPVNVIFILSTRNRGWDNIYIHTKNLTFS